MKKILLPIILISSYISAQAPAGYYDGTAGLTGYALKTKVHEIISKKNINWHYDDLPGFYNQTDLDWYYDGHTQANNSTILLDIYSENPTGPDAYEYTSANLISSTGGEGEGYNREHAVPQSTFNSSYPMFSDLHFVIPTDAKINQLRNNYPYGVGNSTIHHTFTNTSKIANSAIPNYAYTNRVYEPIDEFKGDVARMLLYFVVRYENKLPSFNYSTNINPAIDRSALDGTAERAFDAPYIAMLLQWHQQDPVTSRETNRNNAVFAIQKNRNPFIDNPQWVNEIWSQTPDAIVPQAPLNVTAGQTGAYFTTLSWSPSTSSDVIGYNIYQNGVFLSSTKSTTLVVDHLNPSSSYTYTVKSYDNGYLNSSDSNSVAVNTLASDGFAKDLFISKYIEGTSDNKAIEITNKTGHPVDLKDYKLSVQAYGNSNYYFPAGFEMEGMIQNNEKIVILNPRSNLICFNMEQARFVTAAPQLAYDGDKYYELRYKSTTVDALGIKNQSNASTLKDVSLYRKNSVNQPSGSFNSTEWDIYPVDYCQDLGGTLSTSELITSVNKEFKIYPNPVYENIYVSGETEKIQTAQILDFSGKVIYMEKDPFRNKKNISVQGIPVGVYLLRLDDKVQQFIKK
ncbi:Por secretion system C-terminal sorting domain-containing protein [Chryseobacterium ureilyticum]|uniref:Por secretion system C-terminal sorting domain-containing protein n=1 Tax=Chryseobacterium ureilyticum TaxID=373668 RepID=A0A1N7QJS2_9FLAO|nr:endonuclease [Chryseobacterium ureilyticum]SIT23024.1 Por secretion system C-terminal sorting domain-containing protein [Chryseobacterium ureilyticum]